jgi:hypothetical protein
MSRRRDELVPHQPNVVVLESYVSSSEGPTIHIDVQGLARLNELEALMQNLASGKLQRVLLSHIADAHWVPPLEEVVLNVSEKDSSVSNENRGDRLVCKWTESAEGWLESAEKIAAMVASGKPCHQYFKGSHADTATIKLAYLE